MSIRNDDPVRFVVGHQPAGMDALPFRGTALLNLVKAGVRSAIPDHVACVRLIDQQRADGGVGPLAAYADMENDPQVPAKRTHNALTRIVDLYDAWDATEPGKGHDANAAEWRAKLPHADLDPPSP